MLYHFRLNTDVRNRRNVCHGSRCNHRYFTRYKSWYIDGIFAGLFSFLVWTFMPPANSVAFAFVFTPFAEPGNFFSLVICFVPRILTGTFAGLSHKAFKKLFAGKKYLDVLQYGISAVIGSLTNTVLVLVGIMVFSVRSTWQPEELPIPSGFY